MLPLIDLKKQYAIVENRVKAAVLDVLDSGQYVMGPEVEKVEEKLASFSGSKYCVSCASGTDALFMALMAKGVGPNSAILTTPFTFVATAEAIALTGATPIFVDVDENTFNISPERLKLAVEAFDKKDPQIHPLPKPALDKDLTLEGIVAVDLFGLPANFEEINNLANERGLFVIEDAAQSFGSSQGDKKGGNLADIGCTSFFPAKPLGCYGDGGAIFCNDEETKKLLESIRVHGQGSNKYENVRLGVTGRLDAIQAAVISVKLDIFSDEIEARQRVAATYQEMFASVEGVAAPKVISGSISAWAQYTLKAVSKTQRDAYVARLADAKIGHAIYYPIPLHQQKAYDYLDYVATDFPVSLELAGRVFSVPMHPYLTTEEISHVINVLRG